MVVTTIEELDLDANAMSAAAAQGIMMLENDPIALHAAAAAAAADNRKAGGGEGTAGGEGNNGKTILMLKYVNGAAKEASHCELLGLPPTLILMAFARRRARAGKRVVGASRGGYERESRKVPLSLARSLPPSVRLIGLI